MLIDWRIHEKKIASYAGSRYKGRVGQIYYVSFDPEPGNLYKYLSPN